MSFVSLFSDERGFLATDQRVFAPDEIARLATVLEQSECLSSRLAEQSAHIEQARQDARVEGLAAGEAEARQQSSVELAARLLELQQRHDAICAGLQQDCAALAVDIVRKIAGEIAPAEWLMAQASRASEELIDSPELSLRVHADQRASVKALCDSRSSSPFVNIIGDTDVPSHACILETSAGSVEVDLENQLSQILHMLRREESADGL